MRHEAFGLLIALGEIAISNQEAAGMDAGVSDDSGQAGSLTFNEYLRILVAGLAGNSPHMISAATISVARVVYEVSQNHGMRHKMAEHSRNPIHLELVDNFTESDCIVDSAELLFHCKLSNPLHAVYAFVLFPMVVVSSGLQNNHRIENYPHIGLFSVFTI